MYVYSSFIFYMWSSTKGSVVFKLGKPVFDVLFLHYIDLFLKLVNQHGRLLLESSSFFTGIITEAKYLKAQVLSVLLW